MRPSGASRQPEIVHCHRFSCRGRRAARFGGNSVGNSVTVHIAGCGDSARIPACGIAPALSALSPHAGTAGAQPAPRWIPCPSSLCNSLRHRRLQPSAAETAQQIPSVLRRPFADPWRRMRRERRNASISADHQDQSARRHFTGGLALALLARQYCRPRVTPTRPRTQTAQRSERMLWRGKSQVESRQRDELTDGRASKRRSGRCDDFRLLRVRCCTRILCRDARRCGDCTVARAAMPSDPARISCA